MIDYIKGTLEELQPAQATVEAAGIGYDLNISLTTFSDIQGRKEVKLYIYEQIREDAWTLYAFSTREERELFLLLISVSGVGAGTARMMLSSMTPRELAATIAREDASMLKTIKGIGLRTAQRIVVELKDKLKEYRLGYSGAADDGESIQNVGETAEEAITALTMLGFSTPASRKTVNAIVKKQPHLTVEQLIKESLKEMR